MCDEEEAACASPQTSDGVEPITALAGVLPDDLRRAMAALPARRNTGVFFVLHAVMLLLGEDDTQYEHARALLGGPDAEAALGRLNALGATSVLPVKPRTLHGLDALVQHPCMLGRDVARHGGPVLVALREYTVQMWRRHTPQGQAVRGRHRTMVH